VFSVDDENKEGMETKQFRQFYISAKQGDGGRVCEERNKVPLIFHEKLKQQSVTFVLYCVRKTSERNK